MRKLLTVVAVVGALVAVAAVPASAAEGDRGHRHGRTLQELGLPRPGNPTDVVSNYTLIEEHLLIPHPEEWGGAFVDGDVLVVNTVTRAVPEAQAVLRSLGIRRGVEVRQVTTSVAALAEATDTVAGAGGELSGAVVSVGPDYSQSRIVVGLREGTDVGAASAELMAVVEQAATGMPVATFDGGNPVAASRYYDQSPLYGGNSVAFSGSGSTAVGCSTAFAWTISSTTYLVSASHCSWSTSAQRNVVSRIVRGGSPIKIGTVSLSQTSGGVSGTVSGKHGDIALVKLSAGVTAAPRVFTGPYNTTTSAVVKSRTSLPQGWRGSNLRSSGAGGYYGNGDGESAPNWISLVNQTITYSSGQRYKNLTVAEHVSTCTGRGDSGGAMYTKIGGGISAVGVISGSDGWGAGTSNCRGYYTPIGYVVTDFGGAVKVG